MVFSSLTFLFGFLPITLFLYYITPTHYRNIVLLIVSLLFYACSDIQYAYLLLLMTLLNYVAGRLLERCHSYKTMLFLLVIICNVLILLYFKYFNFMMDTLQVVTSKTLEFDRVVLPLGISFYTFQCLSYVIDVKKGVNKAEKNYVTFACYVCMFPQLIAGPIVRYREIQDQLMHRIYRMDGFALGIQYFIIGLSKKVILADTMYSFQRGLSQQPSTLGSWCTALAYMMQLYFDFSGYSDMAIGLGHMLGFQLPKNFNYPYAAKGIIEFWKRWHMTLSSWFKEYVYFPLKGSRTTTLTYARNLLIVWGLTGLWHGADWNFVLWGLFFAICIFIEKRWLSSTLKDHSYFAHIYTWLVLLIGFTLFQYSIEDVKQVYALLFSFDSSLWCNEGTRYYIQSYFVALLVCILFCFPLLPLLKKKLDMCKISKRGVDLITKMGLLVLFVICIAYIADASFQPFLYFRF